MPRQERKPGSGCGRRSRISSHNAAVAGPIGHGGVPVIAAGSQMRGDPLALEKDLDDTRRQPDLDLAASEAVGHAVEVRLDLNVVIDANPTQPPFSEGIGLARQPLEMRPVEFLVVPSHGKSRRSGP